MAPYFFEIWEKIAYFCLIFQNLPIVKKFLHILLLLLVALLLVLILPRRSASLPTYEEGLPWKYDALIASFDFPVQKDDKVLIEERDSVVRNLPPFFQIDEAAGERQVSRFAAAVAGGHLGEVPLAFRQQVRSLLLDIYDAGLLSSVDWQQIEDRALRQVRIVQGTEANLRDIETLYTEKTAYERLTQANGTAQYAELLRRVGIEDYLVPNLAYDTVKTQEEQLAALEQMTPYDGIIVSGQRIVEKGEIVTPHTKLALDSYVKESLKRADKSDNPTGRLLGQMVLIFLVLLVFGTYIALYRPDYQANWRRLLLLLALIFLFPALTYHMQREQILEVYLIPYAMVALIVRTFYDSRTAAMAYITTLLLSALPLHGPLEFILVESIMGYFVIFALKNLTERVQILRVAFYAVALGLLTQLAYDFMAGSTLETLSRSRYIFIVMSGFVLLLVYPLLYLFERLGGFTSDVTLLELSNINHPLLRRLSKEAPGTFSHSLQVANLAAELASQLGDAKVQLVRTGALYHDIGKLLNPSFFTENQNGQNPHTTLEAKDGLDPEERSAQIIISHVTHGQELARAHKLPAVITGIISTHHGCGRTGYFFTQWQNGHPDQKAREHLFTYPGPDPSTREQAILMMADAVEAASHSLKEPTDEMLAALVSKIIDGQHKSGRFRNCPLTFRDIEVAKRVLTENLKAIYHTRVSYPEPQRPKRFFRKKK